MTRAPAMAIVMLAATAAAAAPAPESIDVDRDDAPPGRGELGFDGGGPVGDYAVSASLGYLDRPIALRDDTGIAITPVATRETLGLGGALALGDNTLADLHLGFAHQRGDRLAGLGDDRPLDAWVPLDARLGVRLRVMAFTHISMFLRGELTVPLGDEHDFAGDAGWTGAWHFIARMPLPAGVIVAASVGIRLRGSEVMIADRRVGNETLAALGVVVPLPALRPLWSGDQLALTGELVKIAGDQGDGTRGPSPAEARVGVVSRPYPWREVAARAGAGLNDEIGAPRWRVGIAVTWRMPAAPPSLHPPPPPPADDDESTVDD